MIKPMAFDTFLSENTVKSMVFTFLGSLIKRGLHRVLKPNETLKESFANPKFLLFRVFLQECNFLPSTVHLELRLCLKEWGSGVKTKEIPKGRIWAGLRAIWTLFLEILPLQKSKEKHAKTWEKPKKNLKKITPLHWDPKQQELKICEEFFEGLVWSRTLCEGFFEGLVWSRTLKTFKKRWFYRLAPKKYQKSIGVIDLVQKSIKKAMVL